MCKWWDDSYKGMLSNPLSSSLLNKYSKHFSCSSLFERSHLYIMQAPESKTKCIVHKAPNTTDAERPSLFLAGSIEMGKAVEWQKWLTEALEHLPITIFNPRRDDWDNTLPQDLANAAIKEQIDWESKHLDRADLIALYFDPATTSPVSLLELGLYAKSGKLVVCCPEGYRRRANVQHTCQKHGIECLNRWEEFESNVRGKVEELLDGNRAVA